MLRRLPFKQLLEWRDFDLIEPFNDRRGDWQAASICAILANAFGKKRFKVSDFLLEFDAEPAGAKPAKSWQELKKIAQQMVKLYGPPKPRRKVNETGNVRRIGKSRRNRV